MIEIEKSIRSEDTDSLKSLQRRVTIEWYRPYKGSTSTKNEG